MSKINKVNTDFYNKVVELLKEARISVVRTVNKTMVYTYFEIGRIIVEEEQKGKVRAEYGKELLKGLSEKLTKEFGKGFSIRNLEQMRKFYLVYGKATENKSKIKTQTLSAEFENTKVQMPDFKLSWSHYLFLMGIEEHYN